MHIHVMECHLALVSLVIWDTMDDYGEHCKPGTENNHNQSHLYVKSKNTKYRRRVAKWLGIWEMEQDKEVSITQH